MATGSALLTPGSAVMPDGSASNAAPGTERVKSSAGAPSPYFLQLLFDADVKEQCCWSFRMPANYASNPVLKVGYKAKVAITGGLAFEARLAAVSDGDAQDVDAKAFGAANLGTATVPGTVGHRDEVTVTLTNADGLAAGDLVTVYLARDPAHGSDTAAGDIAVTDVTLDYTTT